ncbi:hypothetical protein [Sporolactobacillus inulinus]|uniref:Uncharacterized protein n=1 Tax=Sporolactobacillus inulinus CASD TaxID=1069536 RepID=A0A0U1QQ81_9BACL|nr:hypothetical protein [Sporolactobacillus inulinus]KLI02786.1 hypothetical protein SINU_06205 [Sporolactobacillus inulinus CASD]GEB78312.1 hypothetical protein SIN01_26570 [Sporolactobacillus inulinus]
MASAEQKRELLIHIIKNMSEKDISKVFRLITEYQKSLIPYDDEPLTEEEKKALEEYDAGKMELFSYEEVFRDGDREKQ